MAISILAATGLLACGGVQTSTQPDITGDTRPAPPPRAEGLNVTLDVFEFDDADAAELDAAAALADARAVVAEAEALERNGVRIVGARRDFVEAFRQRTGDLPSRGHRSTTVLAAADREARLDVADAMAPRKVTISLYEGPSPKRTLEIVPTATGFWLRAARPAEGLIEVRLVPWIRSEEGSETRLEEAAARLVLEPGRPCVLTAVREEKEKAGPVLLCRWTASGRRWIVLVFRVEVP